MARIRICGECRQPVAACICDDDEPGDPQGGIGEDEQDLVSVVRKGLKQSPGNWQCGIGEDRT